MGKDRKHMKKVRKKRIKSVDKQIEEHEEKIEKGEVRKDTTINYWEKEINEKFLKQKEEDEGYLDEH
ncbi:MAG: hypothetical protein NTZ83_01015 [Candidatus Pacearchaeota archaeon]|nr:hypothetical protein [Candidatus Pacearchaeota archaeon]